jgi:hypothetical protein
MCLASAQMDGDMFMMPAALDASLAAASADGLAAAAVGPTADQGRRALTDMDLDAALN